ncbi:MAG: hypothetical protein WA477_01140 [Candidatus Sulfotelmatobacter sp.]
MSSETSDQMMALLQELAALRGLDREYEANPTEAAETDFQQRQRRQEEISREIIAVAEQKQNESSQTTE